MRVYRLFTLAASLAMLLPFGAQAAQAVWPGGGRAEFVNDCVSIASKNLGQASAQAHCDCGADTAEKKLSPAEMKVLDDQTDIGRAARAKLLKEVDTACPRK
ncbi:MULTISPECIES: hypothetical protein [unclassified Pseudomonas]|uniref:hypothetical protein n=1 Tax=unclassified Pseudomonas TaxID=196821 RepID=UPI002AC8E7B7|nr:MULTISPECIES: hypothetical protein [unclassified Pseudomonas]MEB0039856.1 hypothetical protein [Pseudomonas sp. MH10]MEB0077202.1 hypothetical protein [Pseudomonas sp. MH10out]MEB0091467.1 hypothetical protein [Pseudomonas sp. CCI4.2]MEB0101549.1 hypothetical protein [Pseudomonas sp. CCI3.2]MEB0120660.1 hypothetical protein [Pseudomonas sp. CCI1.2]